MKNKGKAFVLILLCAITILNASSVFAGVIVYGSEAKGYMVDSEQLREKKATFNTSALDAEYKSYVTGGAKLWNDTGVVTFKQSKNSPNRMYTYNDKNTNVAGLCARTGVSANGKILVFEIRLNKYHFKKMGKKLNKALVAHEFGHALGLEDLYNDCNRGQIMNGSSRRTAIKPSAKDIKGAKYATRK